MENHLRIVTWDSACCRFQTSNPPLYEFKDLKELNLKKCFVQQPRIFLENLASGCLNLEKLHLGGWGEHLGDGNVLLPIISNCKSLRYLNLMGNRFIQFSIYERICEDLPQLELLTISPSMSDKAEVSNFLTLKRIKILIFFLYYRLKT